MLLKDPILNPRQRFKSSQINHQQDPAENHRLLGYTNYCPKTGCYYLRKGRGASTKAQLTQSKILDQRIEPLPKPSILINRNPLLVLNTNYVPPYFLSFLSLVF